VTLLGHVTNGRAYFGFTMPRSTAYNVSAAANVPPGALDSDPRRARRKRSTLHPVREPVAGCRPLGVLTLASLSVPRAIAWVGRAWLFDAALRLAEGSDFIFRGYE